MLLFLVELLHILIGHGHDLLGSILLIVMVGLLNYMGYGDMFAYSFEVGQNLSVLSIGDGLFAGHN
jgi:hypothetical protein